MQAFERGLLRLDPSKGVENKIPSSFQKHSNWETDIEIVFIRSVIEGMEMLKNRDQAWPKYGSPGFFQFNIGLRLQPKLA